MRRFQERIGYVLFDNERDIKHAIANDRHDVLKEEMAVHLYRADNIRMDIIYRPLATPRSVRVEVERFTDMFFPLNTQQADKDVVEGIEETYPPRILIDMNDISNWWGLEEAVGLWYVKETIRI